MKFDKPTAAQKTMTAAFGIAVFWICAQTALAVDLHGWAVLAAAVIAAGAITYTYWRVVTRNVRRKPRASERM